MAQVAETPNTQRGSQLKNMSRSLIFEPIKLAPMVQIQPMRSSIRTSCGSAMAIESRQQPSSSSSSRPPIIQPSTNPIAASLVVPRPFSLPSSFKGSPPGVSGVQPFNVATDTASASSSFVRTSLSSLGKMRSTTPPCTTPPATCAPSVTTRAMDLQGHPWRQFAPPQVAHSSSLRHWGVPVKLDGSTINNDVPFRWQQQQQQPQGTQPSSRTHYPAGVQAGGNTSMEFSLPPLSPLPTTPKPAFMKLMTAPNLAALTAISTPTRANGGRVPHHTNTASSHTKSLTLDCKPVREEEGCPSHQVNDDGVQRGTDDGGVVEAQPQEDPSQERHQPETAAPGVSKKEDNAVDAAGPEPSSQEAPTGCSCPLTSNERSASREISEEGVANPIPSSRSILRRLKSCRLLKIPWVPHRPQIPVTSAVMAEGMKPHLSLPGLRSNNLRIGPTNTAVESNPRTWTRVSASDTIPIEVSKTRATQTSVDIEILSPSEGSSANVRVIDVDRISSDTNDDYKKDKALMSTQSLHIEEHGLSLMGNSGVSHETWRRSRSSNSRERIEDSDDESESDLNSTHALELFGEPEMYETEGDHLRHWGEKEKPVSPLKPPSVRRSTIQPLLTPLRSSCASYIRRLTSSDGRLSIASGISRTTDLGRCDESPRYSEFQDGASPRASTLPDRPNSLEEEEFDPWDGKMPDLKFIRKTIMQWGLDVSKFPDDPNAISPSEEGASAEKEIAAVRNMLSPPSGARKPEDFREQFESMDLMENDYMMQMLISGHV